SDRSRRTATGQEQVNEGSVPPNALHVDPMDRRTVAEPIVPRMTTAQHPSPHAQHAPTQPGISLHPHAVTLMGAVPQQLAATPQLGRAAGMMAAMPGSGYPSMLGSSPAGLDPKLGSLSGAEPVHAAPPSVAVHDYIETLNVLVALLEQERGE